MITVEINNKGYKLPTGFTVAQWQEMMLWDFENPKHWPRIFEIALGVPQEETGGEVTDGEVVAMSFIIAQMSARVHYEIPDFNELKFGQFVDLDVYVNLGIDKNLQNMLDVLELPIEMAPQALTVIEQFVLWRTSVYRQYKSLFGLHDKDFEEWADDQEPQDPMATARGWYRIIVELAGDNILNMDAVTEEPLKKVLNFMALQKEKKLAEAEAIRKQRKQAAL